MDVSSQPPQVLLLYERRGYFETLKLGLEKQLIYIGVFKTTFTKRHSLVTLCETEESVPSLFLHPRLSQESCRA